VATAMGRQPDDDDDDDGRTTNKGKKSRLFIWHPPKLLTLNQKITRRIKL